MATTFRSLVGFTLSACFVASQPLVGAPPGEKFEYKTIGDKSLAIYVTKPTDVKSAEKRPAILFFHGGGWTGGSPGQFNEHAKYFASRGLVCFQVQYRLLPKKKKVPPVTCIRDARSAMRWVRGRADEFGVDPNRIASAGGSAGGHLAATLGTINKHDEPGEDTSVSAKSNAMILFNPVYDNGPGEWGAERVGEEYQDFSPAHNITPNTPPTITFLGDSDALIPVATLERFDKQLADAGVVNKSIIFPGEGHGFFNHGRKGSTAYAKTVIAADEFLQELGWLSGPATLKVPTSSDASAR